MITRQSLIGLRRQPNRQPRAILAPHITPNRGASLDAYNLTSDMVRFLQTVDGRIDAFHPRFDLQ
ncbi:MAG: hypothetical protein DF168_01136 [Candidatus Moanabacter tarae]|uniref:Uncharacterized protein n=1 Tax=Candidatus Moanibacter tarae TaxID=2200854 RepID=A0A2Z4AFY8_9BACT|nr:MAG: hypothetical protein DF168_01136 [Candidatus Moanabacter tarae]